MARRRNKGEERAIAAKRISVLLERARQEALGPDTDLADRYVGMARKVAMKQQLSFTPAQKTAVCKGCGALRTSQNTRVRLRSGRVITSCTCGRIRRRPIGASHGPKETA